MANQQPRPAWFRLSSLAGRAPAPAPARPPTPAPAPTRPVAPIPATVRPSIPIRPTFQPTQTQESVRPPPAASPPPPPPPPPPTTTASPPSARRSPPRPVPAGSSVALPPPAPAENIPQASPPAQAPPPPQPSPPVAPVPRSPIPAPSPATRSPPQKSPVQRETLPIATSAPAPPPLPTQSPKSNTETAPSPKPISPVPKPVASAAATEPINGNGRTATPVPSPKIIKPLERSPAQSPKIKPSSHPPSPFTLPPAQIATDGQQEEPINGNGKTATPVPSSKIVKPLERSPAQSPKIKPSSHPPSPFTLPPAQITTDGQQEEPKIDQKNVLVQHSIDKPMHRPRAHNSSVSSNAKRESGPKDKGTSKKVYDPEELGMRLITLAGENKGAVMELNPSRKKSSNTAGIPHSLQKKQGTASGTSSEDQSGSENGEGKSSNKGKINRSMTMQSPMVTSLNSNVQGLNNSILYNCTFRNNDPGIHLSLTRKGNGSRSSATDK